MKFKINACPVGDPELSLSMYIETLNRKSISVDWTEFSVTQSRAGGCIA